MVWVPQCAEGDIEEGSFRNRRVFIANRAPYTAALGDKGDDPNAPRAWHRRAWHMANERAAAKAKAAAAAGEGESATGAGAGAGTPAVAADGVGLGDYLPLPPPAVPSIVRKRQRALRAAKGTRPKKVVRGPPTVARSTVASGRRVGRPVGLLQARAKRFAGAWASASPRLCVRCLTSHPAHRRVEAPRACHGADGPCAGAPVLQVADTRCAGRHRERPQRAVRSRR